MRMISAPLIVACCLLVCSISASAGEPTPGKQIELSLKTEAAGDVPYLFFLPKGYAAEPEKKWPVMVFLHGRGESYGELSMLKKWGPPKIVERGEDLPYIIVSPQCPGDSRWSAPEQQAGVLELLSHVQKNFRTDEDRVYLTGLSMGGYGSWKLAADHAEKFAAVAPICGAGDPSKVEKLKTIPVWAFHGTEDGAVAFEKSVEMVEAIKKAGGTKVKFTSLEGIGHNSWSAAYATPELYQWFEKFTISGNRAK